MSLKENNASGFFQFVLSNTLNNQCKINFTIFSTQSISSLCGSCPNRGDKTSIKESEKVVVKLQKLFGGTQLSVSDNQFHLLVSNSECLLLQPVLAEMLEMTFMVLKIIGLSLQAQKIPVIGICDAFCLMKISLWRVRCGNTTLLFKVSMWNV